jgi:riboflavin kinase / FMN adenylyltransferase
MPRIEVHLLDHQADLYDKTLTFTFLHHLRGEKAFPSVNELIQQLHQDCADANRLLTQSL